MTTPTMERPTIVEPIAMVRAPYVAPQADLQEAKSPGTVESVEGVGAVAWTNPSNTKASDDSWATVTPKAPATSSSSHYLKATGFGFALEGDAIPLGIIVTVERSDGGASVFKARDNRVHIVKGGVIQEAENKAIPSTGIGGPFWPATDTAQEYGGGSDLWGQSWDAADINAPGFGVALSAWSGEVSARVDHIQITVYYTEAGDDENHVCYQGRSLDFRTEGVFRQHPEDDVWGELVNEGFNLQAPPSFLEGRALRGIVVPSTGDLEALADSGTHDIEAVVKYRPAYHFAREAIDHGS